MAYITTNITAYITAYVTIYFTVYISSQPASRNMVLTTGS